MKDPEFMVLPKDLALNPDVKEMSLYQSYTIKGKCKYIIFESRTRTEYEIVHWVNDNTPND